MLFYSAWSSDQAEWFNAELQEARRRAKHFSTPRLCVEKALARSDDVEYNLAHWMP